MREHVLLVQCDIQHPRTPPPHLQPRPRLGPKGLVVNALWLLAPRVLGGAPMVTTILLPHHAVNALGLWWALLLPHLAVACWRTTADDLEALRTADDAGRVPALDADEAPGRAALSWVLLAVTGALVCGCSVSHWAVGVVGGDTTLVWTWLTQGALLT